jgi:acyl-CoA synthetase (AMP-forming)/AMP-acid ligase II
VILAWVETAGDGIDEGALIAHTKSRLAGYKSPRRVLSTPSIGRSPAGKVDYARLKREAVEHTGS